ncbi:MAG: hydrogenase formation protein HypD [Christensenella sp.]|uniref:hydrogenase formation protein HypD n=1 Tax=Christensenella sp. TaxID=1935934 RepID=UPI002B2003C8|nr:hydrogenase formation protein HypD [Christensenella sp.]MEA5004049.1 hydrogenase formation protein HypD [Christensenella sp.]
MTDIYEIKRFLKEYDGPPVRLMEVCGTHTAAIARNGIPGMLSENVQLVSGPGCPVCVTVTDYIDRLVSFAKKPGYAAVSFGDMLRVPGTRGNLSDARSDGGDIRMVYSPSDTLALAQHEPDTTFVFAAVGFETTTPAYALLLAEAEKLEISNIRLLTALKTMPAAIDWVCRQSDSIDGFLAPGNVSVITGSDVFSALSQTYRIPFAVAGFEGESLLAAIYALVKRHGSPGVLNLYPCAVTAQGNRMAQDITAKYFEPCDAAWRGMGTIRASGMMLRKTYAHYDAGSAGLDLDHTNAYCRCAQVLIGELLPSGCPSFGKACSPHAPLGACMVSAEGSCYQYFINHRGY